MDSTSEAMIGSSNTGDKVNEFLAAAGVGPGNPWCASFVTWSLEHSGHKMPGGGWAAVSTWVHNAEAKQNDLQIVSADQARPGDIVAYDWGGDGDFGSDGHIGFLASNVQNGNFTAIEGNNHDAVSQVPRTTGVGKVVFIRVGGGGAPPVDPSALQGGGSAPPVVPEPSGQAPVDPSAVSGRAAHVELPKSPEPDPQQYGVGGKGGDVSLEAKTVLDSGDVKLDPETQKMFQDGKVDPRVAAVLLKLSEHHKIELVPSPPEPPEAAASGSHSNAYEGRGVSIGTIDGEPVTPDSPAARELAAALADLDPKIRPSQIGSPFAIGAAGYFKDDMNPDKIQIGFDQPIDKDWKAPSGIEALEAKTAAPPVVDTPPAPQAPQAPVTPPSTGGVPQAQVFQAIDPNAVAASAPPAGASAAADAASLPKGSRESASFMAVTAKAAEATTGGHRDSASFMAVPDNKAQAAAPVAQTASVMPGAGAAVVDLTNVSDVYPGDNAPKEQVAAWMAKMAEERGLPKELPLMASLVESGMRNIHYGDADSVGFFQMRVGIWNRGDYAGFPDRPELQVKWFLDQAVAAKQQRIARGLPIDDPNHYGDWIADVERPAAQYRGRYQLKLAEATNLLKQAGLQQQPAPVVAAPPPPVVTAPPPPAPSGGGQSVEDLIAASQ